MDVVVERIGPAVLFTSMTQRGNDFLLDVCKASEVISATVFQVPSPRAHVVENAAKERGIVMKEE